MNQTESKAAMLSSILKSYFEWWETSSYPFGNWISVLVVFLIFCLVLTTFILTLYWYFTNPSLPMRKVNSPFTMRLDCQSATSLGIRSEFSSKKVCYILPFWGVPTCDFYEMMDMNWSTMKHTLLENDVNTFKNKCIVADPFIRLEAGSQISHVFIPPPTVYNDERMDQGLFPLVIVMLYMEDSMENIEEPFIFFQATVIKVPEIVMSIERRSDNRATNFPDNVSRIPEVMVTYLREFIPRSPSSVKIYQADGPGLTA